MAKTMTYLSFFITILLSLGIANAQSLFGRLELKASQQHLLRDTARQNVLGKGLVGRWQFNEGGGLKAYDTSVNTNDGTLTNGPIWASGPRGGALEFDGSDDYVDLPDGIDNFDSEASLTMWVKLNNATPSVEEKTGFVKLTEVIDSGGSSHYPWTGGTLYINTFRSARVDSITPSSNVDRTSWHMVTITNTPGAAGWKFYQNTELITTATGEADIDLNNDEGFWIGRSDTNGSSSDYFIDGLIDDVRIYDRALSVAEVALLYRDRLNHDIKPPIWLPSAVFVDAAAPAFRRGVHEY